MNRPPTRHQETIVDNRGDGDRLGRRSAASLGSSQRASGLRHRLPANTRERAADQRDDLRRSVSALHGFVELVDRVRRIRVRGLVLLLALNVGDVGTTMWFLALGGRERNPVVVPIVDHWWGLAAIKLAVLTILAKGVLAAPPRSASAQRLVVVAACYYAIVVASNLRVIFSL